RPGEPRRGGVRSLPAAPLPVPPRAACLLGTTTISTGSGGGLLRSGGGWGMGRGSTPAIVWALALRIALPQGAEARRARAGRVHRSSPVTADAALVMDIGTGEVLFERNTSEPLPPASTTKVMTAILALESGRLDETFRVSVNASEAPPSKIGLRP